MGADHDGSGRTRYHGLSTPRNTPQRLAPTNPLVMWAFSDLSDPRWKFTKKYMVLTQDRKNTGQPQKLGHLQRHTWGAYLLGSDLFIKRYEADPSKPYPDIRCSFETFTGPEFLELETLGPLTRVEPGADSGARGTLDPPSQREDFFMDRRGTGSRNPAVAVAGLKKRNPFTGVRSLDN